jgi:phospholipase C
VPPGLSNAAAPRCIDVFRDDADTYHALADAGYLDNTVLIVTFDERGGFFDHVPPPRVVDNTDPSTVDHTGDGTIPTDGQLVPDYRQLGFRVPTIVVSNRAPARIVHDGPFEHASTLKLIESTFGLQPLTARAAHAKDLGRVLEHSPRRPVHPHAIPTSGVAAPDTEVWMPTWRDRRSGSVAGRPGPSPEASSSRSS